MPNKTPPYDHAPSGAQRAKWRAHQVGSQVHQILHQAPCQWLRGMLSAQDNKVRVRMHPQDLRRSRSDILQNLDDGLQHPFTINEGGFLAGLDGEALNRCERQLVLALPQQPICKS